VQLSSVRKDKAGQNTKKADQWKKRGKGSNSGIKQSSCQTKGVFSRTREKNKSNEELPNPSAMIDRKTMGKAT